MIDFFASLTVGLIVVMTIVILYSNQRQAHALNEMKNIVEGWVESQMRDRREARLNKTKIDDPIKWFGKYAGLKLSDVQRKLEKPPVLEFLAEEGKRLVVSPLEPSQLRKELRSIESKKKNIRKLVEPLLGKKWKKVEVTEKNPSVCGEWFDIEAEAATDALQVKWRTCDRLWFYVISPRIEEKEPLISFDFSRHRKWIDEQKEKVVKWFKIRFTKSSS